MKMKLILAFIFLSILAIIIGVCVYMAKQNEKKNSTSS